MYHIIVILLTMIMASPVGFCRAANETNSTGYLVQDLQWQPAESRLIIHGNRQPAYTVYELFSPRRVVVDIADGRADKNLSLPMTLTNSPISRIKGSRPARIKPEIIRLELDLDPGFIYAETSKDNDIVLTISPRSQPDNLPAGKQDPIPPAGLEAKNPLDQILATLSPAPPIQAGSKKTTSLQPHGRKKKINAAPKAETYSGYHEKKISVDFHKIDLHNVFRLMGEISGRNIVVDEGVKGTLTLSLKEVPWDFILDIILNLKDLAREEQFNTIVISPKEKKFRWPDKKKEKNLTVKEETLAVVERLAVSSDQIKARKILHQASTLEKHGKFAAALALYEKAFELIPTDGALAEKLTSFCLLHLGQYAKAAHYGRIACQLLTGNNSRVALKTAVSLANMEKLTEARDYFELATSINRPSRQALAAYAAFCEQNKSYEVALTLLGRYESLYASSLETMVSKARIYDLTDRRELASREYRAILLSGYDIPEDLQIYINNRPQ